MLPLVPVAFNTLAGETLTTDVVTKQKWHPGRPRRVVIRPAILRSNERRTSWLQIGCAPRSDQSNAEIKRAQNRLVADPHVH